LTNLANWHQCVSDMIGETDPRAACRTLGAGLAALVPSDQWWIILFTKGEVPILFDYYDSPERMDRYADGPYLMCPFYNAFTRGIEPGCYSARALGNAEPVKFSRYSKYYFEPLGPLDEIGIMQWLDDRTMALVSIDRTRDRPRYGKQEREILATTSPIIAHVVGKAWRDTQQNGPGNPAERENRFNAHVQLMEDFGKNVLTRRESEVAKFMLKGFTASEIARFLDISYSTARIHMRRVYEKMGVSSQTQLCGNFVEQLLGLSDA